MQLQHPQLRKQITPEKTRGAVDYLRMHPKALLLASRLV